MASGKVSSPVQNPALLNFVRVGLLHDPGGAVRSAPNVFGARRPEQAPTRRGRSRPRRNGPGSPCQETLRERPKTFRIMTSARQSAFAHSDR